MANILGSLLHLWGRHLHLWDSLQWCLPTVLPQVKVIMTLFPDPDQGLVEYLNCPT